MKAYNSGYNLVSWKEVPQASGYYCLQKTLQQVAHGQELQQFKNSVLQYKDSKVTANASYRYTVRAYYQANGKNYLSKYTTGPVIKAAPALQKVSSVKSERMESAFVGVHRRNVTDITFIERKKVDLIN